MGNSRYGLFAKHNQIIPLEFIVQSELELQTKHCLYLLFTMLYFLVAFIAFSAFQLWNSLFGHQAVIQCSNDSCSSTCSHHYRYTWTCTMQDLLLVAIATHGIYESFFLCVQLNVTISFSLFFPLQYNTGWIMHSVSKSSLRDQ